MFALRDDVKSFGLGCIYERNLVLKLGNGGGGSNYPRLSFISNSVSLGGEKKLKAYVLLCPDEVFFSKAPGKIGLLDRVGLKKWWKGSISNNSV